MKPTKQEQEAREAKIQLGINIEDLSNQYDKLTNTKLETIDVKDKMILERSGISTFLGDKVFRPDNPKRKRSAIKSLDSLVERIKQTQVANKQFSSDTAELTTVVDRMEVWSTEVVTLVPLMQISIAVPEITETATSDWGNILNISTGITGILAISALKKGIFTPALGYAVGITAVFAIVGGVFVGEARKKKFEDIKENADTANNDLKDGALASYEQQQQGIKDFFSEIGTILDNAGFNVNKFSTHTDILDTLAILNKKVIQLQSSVDTAKACYKNGMDADESAKIGAIGMGGTNEDKLNNAYLLKAITLYPDSSAEELKVELELTNEQADRITAQKLISQGKTPKEIIEITNMPSTEINELVEENKKLDIVMGKDVPEQSEMLLKLA